mmetsp:Transcript_22605/g.64616  ORF Transcript_22605/g.64616 Transcript_22605/m.64616 type:complete len:238 (+) Transcript_22605:1841-2554(+)
MVSLVDTFFFFFSIASRAFLYLSTSSLAKICSAPAASHSTLLLRRSNDFSTSVRTLGRSPLGRALVWNAAIDVLMSFRVPSRRAWDSDEWVSAVGGTVMFVRSAEAGVSGSGATSSGMVAWFRSRTSSASWMAVLAQRMVASLTDMAGTISGNAFRSSSPSTTDAVSPSATLFLLANALSSGLMARMSCSRLSTRAPWTYTQRAMSLVLWVSSGFLAVLDSSRSHLMRLAATTAPSC